MEVIRDQISHRIFFDEPVVLHLPGTDQIIRGRALNLSCGGIYVCAEKVLPADSGVTIQFALPGDEPILASARVIRTICPTTPLEPTGMALCFEQLPSQHAERIERFILDRLQPASGEPVRLQLGDVRVPINARTLSSRGNVISLDAELPFLRIGSAVTLYPSKSETPGSGGCLRWVSVHVSPETGIPRLTLGVELGTPSEEFSFEEEADPVCTPAFVDHSQNLDQKVRIERRAPKVSTPSRRGHRNATQSRRTPGSFCGE